MVFVDALQDETLQSEIRRVCLLSPFFEDLIERYPSLAENAFSGIDTYFNRDQLHARFRQFLSGQLSLNHSSPDKPNDVLGEKLRLLRQSAMIRIVFRDLTRRSDLFQTTAELSHLADFCVEEALDHCYREAVSKYGAPMTDGQPEKMIVLGMGKLGALELNLSSDVDLIFLYSNQGEIEREGGKLLSFQEFFLRLARQVIACLDDTSSIDKVFRVDMRLRPYGDSGPLVLHRAAMEKYYLEQGRDWERYAFIKARVMAGDQQGGADFLDWMKPFIYRRHLDYSAILSLREMKGLIEKQVELKEMTNDLKLGPGGIREVEFIAQAHQLIWGGKYAELQQPSLMNILDKLVAFDFLPRSDVDDLRQAYVFLRNSEHAVQAEHDRQTHRLPDEEESRQRLANAMGFSVWGDYLTELDDHRANVSRCFENLIAASADQDGHNVEDCWVQAWQTPDMDDLVALKADIKEMQLQDAVIDAIDQLVPMVLQCCQKTDDAAVARSRMIAVIRSILRRSTYLVFLNENIDALERAVALSTISLWIADKLEAYPILLYELTDRSLLEVSVSKRELEGELREVMRTVEIGDLETQMDTLRQFKLSATLKIAAMELLDRLSIMQASDGLTALAEVLLETSMDLAWYHLEGKHGLPCDASGQPLNCKIAIIAYGKAGGLELAYGSDLDLVFLGPDDIRGNTDGHSPVNNNVFYVRLGQRVIHILTSFTRFGILYEADMRLRPQGNKGPLVATMNAFERYQQTEAWTWEHQALVRARFVAGDSVLGKQFGEIRASIVETGRDRTSLLQDVLVMREKMRQHLASPGPAGSDDGLEVLGKFDLKHDAGAIVDIEFMVQYAVLGWASEHKVLSRWTDVMRLLDELAQSGIFSEEEAESLQRAYLAFRAAVHHGWLGLPTDFERLQTYRQQVHQIWNERMLETNR